MFYRGHKHEEQEHSAQTYHNDRSVLYEGGQNASLSQIAEQTVPTKS